MTDHLFIGSLGFDVFKPRGTSFSSGCIALIIFYSSSAVISIGAATLADMYEPAERGTKVRIVDLQNIPSANPQIW